MSRPPLYTIHYLQKNVSTLACGGLRWNFGKLIAQTQLWIAHELTQVAKGGQQVLRGMAQPQWPDLFERAPQMEPRPPPWLFPATARSIAVDFDWHWWLWAMMLSHSCWSFWRGKHLGNQFWRFKAKGYAPVSTFTVCLPESHSIFARQENRWKSNHNSFIYSKHMTFAGCIYIYIYEWHFIIYIT